tara:strand:- start:1585 stop:2196 length:612 start_codon:yes stop_codon:yes gene_type:complete
MLLFLCMLATAEEPIISDEIPTVSQETLRHKDILVTPPTVDDVVLKQYIPYLTSIVVAQSSTDSHWVRRSNRGDTVSIYDKYTIGLKQDSVCDYGEPIKCGIENMHWVLITDIFTSENFATIVMKLYDEDAQLIATNTKSSYSVETCRDQTTTTIINQSSPAGQSQTAIVEKKPDKCILLHPKILDKDIKQAVTILFASIKPL